MDMFNHTNVDFEHCVCPDGYFGIRCEYEVEECGNSGHVCLHGSTCNAEPGNTKCNCDDADELAAGLYCEFTATDECDTTAAIPGQEHRGILHE